MMSQSGKKGKEAPDAISQRLKEYYDSVEQEPIPGQLLDLLERLDAAEEEARSKRAASGSTNSSGDGKDK